MCKNARINGLNHTRSIANAFISQCRVVYYNSDEDTASVNAFVTMFKNYWCSNSCENVIINGLTTEFIEQCVNHLKRGKACGPDELSAGHIKHAHPLLVHCVRDLIISMVRNEHISSCFSKDIIVSVVKDKSCYARSSTNYRPITLVPIIS